MGSMSIVHWMIVVGVVVLLFGKGKISGLMGDLAQGMKSFKKGLQEDEPVGSTVQKTTVDFRNCRVSRTPDEVDHFAQVVPICQCRDMFEILKKVCPEVQPRNA